MALYSLKHDIIEAVQFDKNLQLSDYPKWLIDSIRSVGMDNIGQNITIAGYGGKIYDTNWIVKTNENQIVVYNDKDFKSLYQPHVPGIDMSTISVTFNKDDFTFTKSKS